MKPWLRVITVLLTVGGGFTGFAMTLQQLFRASALPLGSVIVIYVFLLLYAFVTASGILFVQNDNRIAPLLVAFALQVPWISSPLLTYRFTAGFHVTAGIIGGGFNGGFSLGSDWVCILFKSDAPYGAGVNLFAIVMLAIMAHSLKQVAPRPIPSYHQDPGNAR